MTTTASPSVGCTRRMPCSAIAPSTVNAASSSETPSGTRAHRFTGTLTTSACLPLDTTRSPISKFATPPPVIMTRPTLQ